MIVGGVVLLRDAVFIPVECIALGIETRLFWLLERLQCGRKIL